MKISKLLWACEPYPCGSMNVKKIFNSGLRNNLDKNELVVLDNGYHGHRILRSYMLHRRNNVIRLKRMRGRHDTLKRRLRQFRTFQHVYRHQPKNHH